MVMLRILLGMVMLQGMAWAFPHTLNFNSNGSNNTRKSDLTLLGYDTFVEIGAFTPGFEPTAMNRASWPANWTPLKRIKLDVPNQSFDGSVNLENNSTPFTTSNKIWIWLYDGSGDWCLFSRTSWLWPDTFFFQLSQPPSFTPSTANIVVAGTLNASSPRIVCEKITDAVGPLLSYADWASLWALPGGAAGKNQDADGDGRSNLLEYAVGGNPMSGEQGSPVVSIFPHGGQPHLAAKISRGWVTGVTYTVQWSENLTNWFTTGLTTVANTPQLLEVRDTNPVGTEERRFLRVLLTSPD